MTTLTILLCLLINIFELRDNTRQEKFRGKILATQKIHPLNYKDKLPIPRYRLYRNQIVNEDLNSESRVRHIEVLVNVKQLNPNDLTTLFRGIKKRFPRPVNLIIDVYTNSKQLPTHEEMKRGMSEVDFPKDRKRENYPWASYSNDKNIEAFIYANKKPYSDTVRVVIRGN
jgi:hypothetical protein